MGDYDISCIKCGIRKNLKMYAHRNTENQMVGWVFVCPKCEDDLQDKQLILLEKKI